MAVEDRTITPKFSAAEAEELGRLDYFQKRLNELIERGALAESVPGSVLADDLRRRETIERQGKFRAATARARELRNQQPAEALEWAEVALRIDDSAFETWEMVIDLNWARAREEQAVALCAEAEKRFPQAKPKHEQLLAQQAKHQEVRRLAAEKLQRDREFSELFAAARASAAQGRGSEALALCQQALEVRPGNADVLLIVAFVHQRLGQLDEAIRIYERLTASPHAPAVWRQSLADLKGRRRAQLLAGPGPSGPQAVELGPIDPSDMKSFLPPRFSWAGFTGELMREHWQKLLLCLAVVLIVASSTVGAHLLLGQFLQSPIGVCMTALVWTLMFAGLGAGLVVWGANRAGSTMLALTLIVVPIHFLLIGEMKLLVRPEVMSVAVGALDSAGLAALTWIVAGMLVSRPRARFLTTALLLMSAGGAVAAHESPVPFILRFAAFQTPMVVFLGAIWAASGRRWGETERDRRAFANLVLGLLAPAALIGVAGIGGRALALPPALFAFPLMLGAVAVARISRPPVWFKADAPRAALVRIGGLALSAVAFALAAAASPQLGPTLASANLIAVGLLGFGLYSVLLHQQREPVFLYLAIGALAATFSGVYFLEAETIRAAITAIRAALGIRRPPSRAFLALLGLLGNPLLVWLSFRFRDGWGDARLARHCHYIGLPLAIGACAFSAADPRAAVICLSAYSVLFGLSVWMFAAPWLTGPTIGAIVGAAYFGSTLVPGVTVADQMLLALALAWAFLGADRLLRRLQANDAYAIGWRQAARGLASFGLVGSTLFIAVVGPHSIAAASAFALSGAFQLVLNRERPGASPAALTLISFVELTICILSLMTGGRPLSFSHYGLLLVGDALAMLAAAWVLRISPHWFSGPSSAAFHRAMPVFVGGLTLIADGLAGRDLGASRLTGAVWLLGSLSLLAATRFVPRSLLVYAGLVQFVLGTMDLAFWVEGHASPGLGAGWISITAAADALVLALAGALGRRWGLTRFYSQPCTNVAGVLTIGALALAFGARSLTRDAWPLGTTALVLSAFVTMLLAWARREAELTYVAVFHLVAATGLVLFSVGRNDPAMAYVLGLAAAIEAIVFWWAGLGCERLRNDWARSCSRPLYHWTVLLAGLGTALADGAASAWLTAALAFLLTVKSLRRAEWLYPVIFALGAACYCRWLADASTAAMIAAAMSGAFVLWAIAAWTQARKSSIRDRLGLAPLDYEAPIFHGSLAAGAVALALRVGLARFEPVPGLAQPWLPFSWSALSLLMLRPYAGRGWAHAALAFLCWGAFALFRLAVEQPGLGLLPFGMALALGLLFLERLVRTCEPSLLALLQGAAAPRLVVRLIGPAVRAWGLMVGCVAFVLTSAVVVQDLAARTLAFAPLIDFSVREWWAVLSALGLSAVFVAVETSHQDAWIDDLSERAWIAFHGIGVLALWWAGAWTSPRSAFGLAPMVYDPIATAFVALVANGLGRWHVGAGTFLEVEADGSSAPPAARALALSACALSILAVLLTRAVPGVTTLVVLAMAAASLGLSAWSLASPLAAGLGALAWTGAGALAGHLAARWWAAGGTVPGPLGSSFGAIAAACSLFWLTGRQGPALLRSRGPGASGPPENSVETGPHMTRGFPVVRTIEAVAWAASLIAALAVFTSGTNAGLPDAMLGVGVLLASAVPSVLIAVRWRVGWPLYFAHAALVLAYFHLRRTFPMATAADAAVLALMGYVDLALFEALERLHAPEHLTRPTQHASLIVPLLPLLHFLRPGWTTWDEVGLFYLIAAMTFYAVACARLRWKTLGYAAAVFGNAALWACWGRLGWMLADHPQFYLVPVGLSTILFAEVNRDLGRGTINSIRTLGLIVVYAALALPIWRVDSIGAWLVLLVASLAGTFLGIGLRLQTFLWLGLATFALNIGYETVRLSLDHAVIKWAIMLVLGIGLVMLVALNEKKRIVGTVLDYYEKARLWD